MKQLPVLKEGALRFDEVVLETHALHSQAKEIEIARSAGSDADAHQVLEIRSDRPEVFERSKVQHIRLEHSVGSRRLSADSQPCGLAECRRYPDIGLSNPDGLVPLRGERKRLGEAEGGLAVARVTARAELVYLVRD